jgi:hypothetical protein
MRDREMELLRKILRTRKGLVITLRWVDEEEGDLPYEVEAPPPPRMAETRIPGAHERMDPDVVAWAKARKPLDP